VQHLRELQAELAGLTAELRRLISPMHPEDDPSDAPRLANEISLTLTEHVPAAMEAARRLFKDAAARAAQLSPDEQQQLAACRQAYDALTQEFAAVEPIFAALLKRLKGEQ